MGIRIEEISKKEYEVGVVNSIQKKYPKVRQDAKTPSFALQYQGTYKTLMANCGFTKEEAKRIEKEYHELYKTADIWTWENILKASQEGHVDLAFGLKLRTPMLTQVVIKSNSGLPKECHKEVKTASNALIQSYGLLNTRACNAFMERVWNSEYAEKILPVAQIHDAIYLQIKNEIGCLKFVNDNLIDCMRWCELPELQHPQVKLEAQLEIYYPDWSEGHKVPNDLSLKDLKLYLQNRGFL